MRQIYATRAFQRSIKKMYLSEQALLEAVLEMEHGLIDAELGGDLVKKRIALPGRGKSGGARTIVATRKRGRWIFIYGFPKNVRDNITPVELEALQSIGRDLLDRNDNELAHLIQAGELKEIKDGKT